MNSRIFQDGLLKHENFQAHNVQGSRYRYRYPRSQDAYSYHKKGNIVLTGVYDGHGNYGHIVSREIAEQLPVMILRQLNDFVEITEMEIHKILSNTFLAFADKNRDKLEYQNSGSTVVIAIEIGNVVHFAWCGDAFALWSNNGSVNHTPFHHPDDPLEFQRLLDFGVHVYAKRVMGTLAVSRSIGDFDFQRYLVSNQTSFVISPIPQFSSVNKSELDNGIYVLASDGAIEGTSIDELASLCYHPNADVSRIVEQIFKNGSTDDVTVMIKII